jgi:hypothetical protein
MPKSVQAGAFSMEPEQPPSKASSTFETKGSSRSLRERYQLLVKESLKLENLPFVVLIFLAGISLISRLWLIRH